ncbi:related to NRPS-like enzyme [Cephalotrichum gorgonifer]|uniref:gluconokinase n=1 Tax=Cephalotrichum gorgonifer TaxID=2041049 RepID=A0AAE8N536_9PEZI|nr:related to NRPS-like enzyme [Cephalotrichum gorgonifer]
MSSPAPALVSHASTGAQPESSGTVKPLATLTPTAAALGDNDDSDVQTVDQLIRKRAKTHPHHVVVSYPSSGVEYVDYTMQQLDVFAYRVAKVYQAHAPPRTSSAEKPSVVAIIGPSNLDYLVSILALTKLGHTVLFLSTRITQEAVDNLLTSTGASFLLYDPKHAETAGASQKAVPGLGVLEIATGSSYNFPIEVHADTNLTEHLDTEIETGYHVWIIHSSGSTGLPKPIYQPQKSAVANYAMHMDMKAFITLPLFHNHGISNMFRAIHSCKPIYLYNADLPLTRDYLTTILGRYNFEIFYGVPYALKLLAETAEGIDLLRELKIVMYGGSACPDDLGDDLVSKGVNLVGHYGATEVGQLMTSFRPREDKDWNYVREGASLSPYLHWVRRGPNLFECCVLPGWPSKVASNQPDGSYATKDLFEPHPTTPRAWKYIARLDDTIVLVNGEKFNPVRVEGTIRSNKAVTEAVIFGAGRPNLGVLVVPSASLAGKSAAETLEAIWPVVEAANESVEGYARISKEMVKVLPVGTKFPQTDKGSVIRQAFYRQFDALISEAYDAAEVKGSDARRMTGAELRAFLQGVFADVLPKSVEFDEGTDFFFLGLDSLQAITIRSEILKSVDIGENKLGQTVVFDHPTIDKLTSYLHGLGSGVEVADEEPVETLMQSLIDKYSDELAPAPQTATAYVVTGATGSLGGHIASLLASDPSVTKVYCLVRASSPASASLRLRESLTQRRIHHTLPLSTRRKFVALPSDLSQPTLGLSPETYLAIASSNLAGVIHCAWSVNFNMHLSSFEKSNVAGVSNLIRLCVSARNAGPASAPAPSFNFCSSVSAVARSPVSPVPEAAPPLSWAQGMGYAQSKSVAENLCARAGANLGVPVRVLRVGQIVGDTTHGVWSATEAIPMMLQSAVTIGALPRLSEAPSWLPVDVVARTVVEIASSSAASAFFNVANPRTFGWSTELLPALRAAGLEFDEVEPREWVRRLRESDPDPVKNPPVKLVDFFASKYDKDEFGPSMRYVTDAACAASKALSEAPAITQDSVTKFVRYFVDTAWKIAPVDGATAQQKTVIVVAGPSGSGKSTLAAALSRSLHVPFVEGDLLHSRAAVEKMSGGTPLDDKDRSEWLQRVGAHSLEAVAELGYDAVIVSCSALKRKYRDALRSQVLDAGAQTCFLDLQGGLEVLAERLEGREGHYMSADMADGQLEAYEGPEADETDVFPIDAEESAEAVKSEAKWVLEKAGMVFREEK